MKRRSLLALIGGTVAASGCISSGDTGTTPAITDPDPKALSRYPCPPYAAPGDLRAVCSHTVNTDKANVYLLPSPTKTAFPRDELQFTIYNKSASVLNDFNPYEWSIWKVTEGEWTKVKRRSFGSGKIDLSPGQHKTWDANEVIGFVNSSFQFTVGVYAVEISVPYPSNNTWTRCIALFRILSK